MMHWSFNIQYFDWAALGLVLLCEAGFVWFNVVRGGRTRRANMVLEPLRTVILLLIVGIFFEPEIVKRKEKGEAPRVSLLVDDSASMETRDVSQQNNELISRNKQIRKMLEQTDFVSDLKKTFRVNITHFSGNPEHPGATDIGRALRQDAQGKKNLRAQVLFSDGDWNTGKNPVREALLAGGDNLPVFTVVSGRDTHVPDISLQDITVPAFATVEKKLVIPFSIQNHFNRRMQVPIKLHTEERVLAGKHTVGRRRHVGGRHEGLGPRLVEGNREGEGVGAEAGNASHL